MFWKAPYVSWFPPTQFSELNIIIPFRPRHAYPAFLFGQHQGAASRKDTLVIVDFEEVLTGGISSK
jgi:hypothetical protein